MLPIKLSPFGISVKRLPYDKKVEYLESTGTQWIDTGIPVSSEMSVLADITTVTYNGGWVFGGRQSGGQRVFAISMTVAPQSGFAVAYGNVNPSTIQCALGRHEITLTQRYFYIDDDLKKTFAASSFSTSRLLLLNIAYNADGDPSNLPFTGLLHRAEVRISSTLVRDFIPVRTTIEGKRVGAMYDKANPNGGPNGNGMYYNQGSGDFIIGPDL